MADYTQSQYDRMIENPAAPTGLKQAASRWEQGIAQSAYGPQDLGEDAQSWYGGRNTMGIESGFDNEFMTRAFKSYDDWQQKVVESRRSEDPDDWLNPYDWLDPEKNDGDVTGIALWDDPDGDFRRGDVIEDGRVAPNKNVYEVFGQQEADLLLGDFMFDKNKKARIFKRSDAEEAYAREVEQQSDRWSEEAEHSGSALEYAGDVYEQKEEGWLSDWGGAVAASGGAAGGAALGGGIGFAFGGPFGAAIGTAIGAVVGGTGGFANQDQIIDQIAHGNVQADRAKEKYGTDMFVASQLKHWSGTGMKFISPVSNAVQGGADVWYGEVGDGEAAFYSVDENGDRVANGIWQAADVGAALADGVLQFGSPLGQMAYMTTTGGLVAGQVAELGLTGLRSGDSMAGFNERTGRWQEYEGAGQVAAALGVVAIDAIQMGVARGLSKASREANKVFDPAKAGRVREEQILDGHKFKFDKDGNLISRSVAMSTLIAPSEALRFVTVSWRARSMANRLQGNLPASAAGRYVDPDVKKDVAAAVTGGGMKPARTVTADDYYEAAMELQHGSVLRSAIVNGWAEGAEEGVQAILEPLSFSEKIDGMEVGRSFLYGMASGVGMGLGRVTQPVSDAQRQEYRAKSMWLLREQIPQPQTPEGAAELEAEWKAVWNAASAAEKKRMATINTEESERINEILGVYQELHTHAAMGSQVAYSAMNAARTKKYEELHKNRNRNVDGTRVLMGRGDGGPMVAAGGYVDPTTYIEDAAVQTLEQTKKDLVDIGNGLSEQIDALERRVADLQDELAGVQDADRQTTLQAEIDELQAMAAPLPDALQLNQEIVSRFEQGRVAYYEQADIPAKQSIVAELNAMLLRAHDRAYTNAKGGNVPPEIAEAAKRAVEMKMVRYPGLDAGANTLLLPQVSIVLTELKQEATSYIHQSKLAAMNADHDGDQGVSNNAQVIPVDSLNQLRRGAQYLDSMSETAYVAEFKALPTVKGRKPGFARMRNYVHVKIDRPDGHKTRVEIAQDALLDKSYNGDRRKIVAAAIDGFTGDFLNRYTKKHKIIRSPEERKWLGDALAALAKGMGEGSKNAEQVFLDTIWNTFTEELLVLGDETNQAEMLWQQGRLEKMWTEIQTGLAAQGGQVADRPSSGAPQMPADEATFMSNVSRQDAATLGGTLLALLDSTTDGLRQGQALHYAPWYTSAVDAGRLRREGHQDSVRFQEFVEIYENLGAGAWQSALEEVTESNRIEARVMDMLNQILQEARQANPDIEAFKSPHALALIAMTETVDIEINDLNQYQVNPARNTTVLQLLLQKSLDIEKRESASAREDSDIKKKIKRLEQLTRSKDKDDGHSVTAKRAMFEIFADVPMWQIAGRDSMGIGAHLTPRQLAMSVAQLDTFERGVQADKWRHLPAYLDPHGKKHDPPYTIEEFRQGETNPFTLMVDSIIAEANSHPKDLRKSDDRASEKFIQFHTDLQNMIAQHELRHSDRMRDQGKANKDGTFDKAVVFRDMLETQPRLAQIIADIIPGDAAMAIFSKRDGEVWTANWLEQMLLHDSAQKAELMMFIHSRLAELNYHGGQLEYTDELRKEHKKKLGIWRKNKKGRRPRLADPVRKISDPSKIKSRFNQAIYRIVMEDPTGFELERLLDMAEDSTSREDFMDKFNAEPAWTGGQAEFFMYHDSMETWQEDLSKLWTQGGGSAQLQREALDKAATQLSMLHQGLAEADAAKEFEQILLDDMEQFLIQGGNHSGHAERAVKQLQHARALATQYPDIVGYAARDKYLEMVQVGVPVAHEKGKPNEAAKPIGADLMTSNSKEGYSSAFAQELAALTSNDWKKVMQNVSSLVQGKTRVMLRDGREITIDLSDDLQVVRMLKDPITRDFVKAVFFPTTRDVDANNNMQHYRTASTSQEDAMDAELVTLLTDTELGHLFSLEKLGTMNARQATQFLGMLESGMRKEAIESNDQELREKSDNPLTKALGDFLIAATHGPKKSKMTGQKERDYFLTKAMTALSLVAQLPDDPHKTGSLTRVQEYLKEKLLADMTRQKHDWGFAQLGEQNANILEGLITKSVMDVYHAQQAALQKDIEKYEAIIDKLAQNGAPQADIDAQRALLDAKEQEWLDVQQKIDDYQATPDLWHRVKQLHPSVQSALNRWTQNINNRNDGMLYENRMSLIRYLNTSTRVNALVQKDLYRLSDKVRAALNSDPAKILDEKFIPDADWILLGNLAGTYTVQESAGYIPSAKGLMGIKEPTENEAIARYYDPTWSYLLDFLFDPTVLRHARHLVRTEANVKQLGTTPGEIADYIYNNLVSERQLGEWTPLVVGQSFTARKVLDSGSGEGAVQSEGMAPTEFQAEVAVGMVTYTQPLAEHMSTAQVGVVSAPDSFGSFQAAMSPLEFLKLDRHFVSEVTIQLPDGSMVDPDTVLRQTTEGYPRIPEVDSSAFRVFRSDLMDEYLADLQQVHGSGDYTINIEYVDVDKKPHEPEYAHSIYFDGVGRESMVSTGPGVITEMIFGTGALSKNGQQYPLDFLTAEGASFWQQLVTPHEDVARLEESATSMADLMAKKTRQAFALQYQGSPLQLGDQNAIYKLMKMRHVVRGYDTATGELTYMWAEEVISKESKGEQPLGGMRSTSNPDGYQVIALSDPVLVALLGRPGTYGPDNALTMPEMNLLDVDPFPKLTKERLKELGLSRLGEEAELNDTAFAQVPKLPVATLQTDGRGAQGVTPYELQIEQWWQHQFKVDGARQSDKQTRQDIKKSNKRNTKLLADLTRSEGFVKTLSKLRIPHMDTRDFTQIVLGDALSKRLKDIMGKSNARRIWYHDHSGGYQPENGVLGKVAVDNNFLDVKTNGQQSGPTYRDVVVIDLDKIRADSNYPTMDKAIDEAVRVFRAYSNTGATIVLGAKFAQQLRSEVSLRLRDSGTNYRMMKGSNHFFAPTAVDPQTTDNIAALESISTEVRYITPEEIQYRFVSDYFGTAGSENSTMLDYEHAHSFKFKRVVNTIIPTALATYDGPNKGNARWLWNLPIIGEGPKNQLMVHAQRLLPKLDDPGVVEQLKAMSENADYKKKRDDGTWPKATNNGNPEDIPIMEFDPDTGEIATEGVLDFDRALEDFKADLRQGKDPLRTGKLLRPGDFYMVLRQDGVPMLLRYGFQIPGQQTLSAQLSTRSRLEKGDAEFPLEIGIASASLQAEQTVPPPMYIRRHKTDKMGKKIEGDFAISAMTKGMVQGTGFKAGYRPMPNHVRPPKHGLSPSTWIGSYIAAQPIDSKQAWKGTINNFREAFLMSGVNFKEDMVKFFFGEGSYADEAEMEELWLQATELLKVWSEQYTNMSVDEAAALLDVRGTVHLAQEFFNDMTSAVIPGMRPLKLDQQLNADPMDVTNRIGQIVLTTLLLPDMQFEHIMGTPGAIHVDRTSNTRLVEMPMFMMDALADPNYPAVRNEMVRRVNANAQWSEVSVNGVMKYEYYMNPDFSFDVFMRDENDKPILVKGKLQRVTEFPYEKEAASIAASQLKQKQSASAHTVNVAAETVGAWSVIGRAKDEYEINPLDALLEGKNETLFFTEEGESFHQIFARIKTDMEDYQAWDRKLPMQWWYRLTAQDIAAKYRDPIEKDDWGKEHIVAMQKFLRKLGLKDDQAYEVDRLVRQMLGAPGARGDEKEFEIKEADYLQALHLMQTNIDAGFQPLMGGMVPMPDESFWAKVFKAQQERPKNQRWQPEMRESWKGKRSKKADTWDEWNVTLMAQTRASQFEFNHSFRTDLDGFMHTYLSSSSTFADLPISLDMKRDMELMDPSVNRHMLSIDPGTDAFFANPIILETMPYTLETLTGHSTEVVTQRDARATPSATMAQRLRSMDKWQKEHKVVTQKKQAYRDYYREGAVFLESSSRTHNFFLNLNHLQIINRLANPALYVSAIPETYIKTKVEQLADIAGGRGVTRTQGRLSQALGVRPRYTTEQLMALENLAEHLGSQTEWRAMLYGELLYEDLIQRSAPNRTSQTLERTAATMARITSDPRLGMSGKPAAKRYIAAALEWIDSTDNNMTVEQFVRALTYDPLYLQKQFPDNRANPHTVGINAVGQTRGTKNSYINKVGLGFADRWEHSGNWGLQLMGLMVNVPFRFKRFNVGTFLSMTGLGGFDTLLAMMRDQRPKTSLTGRMQAAMRGVAYEPEGMTDNSDILMGIDITREFSKGAMTQTMLVAAGMWAGELAIDGEDEESKKRRKRAEYLQGPYLYDPRKIENDFLYADALFVDNLGPLSNMFVDEGTGRAVIQPHWIVRQFTSPIVGIQRFFRTGNIEEIRFGFTDAISAIPTSALNIWRDANHAADQLMKEIDPDAENAEEIAAMQDTVTQRVINIAAVYEKALLENSFVNSIRTAKDRFDRDPYAVAATNDIGEIERTDGLPDRSKDLEQYAELDEEGKPTGETGQAYVSRPMSGLEGARSTAYAENNATYAVLASLFSGQLFTGNSQFFRRNMPVKERKVEVPEVGQADAEQLFLAALADAGTEPAITLNEMAFIIKGEYEAADITWEQAEVEAEAQARIDAMSLDGRPGGLFELDADDNAIIQHEGARGIYKALWADQINWDDEVMLTSLPPIPFEVRAAIATEWVDELMQAGVDAGMSQQGAMFYANRVYYGDTMDENSVALADIIFDDRIPTDGTLKYNQLNMMYTIGPDGRPWATPFTKTGIAQAFGIPLPHTPPEVGTGMGVDQRGKSVDLVSNVNTGLHGLVRKVTPEELEFDPFKELEEKTYTPGADKKAYKKWRRGYGSGGGGGYGGYYDTPDMRPLPGGLAPRADGVPMINSNNPYIRRARVDRQRITSQKGRLKQWQ